MQIPSLGCREYDTLPAGLYDGTNRDVMVNSSETFSGAVE